VLSPPPHSHFFTQFFATLSQKSVSVSQVLYADRQINVWHKQYVVVFLQTSLYILKKLRSGRKEYCVQDVTNYAHHSGIKCHINKCMTKDKMVFDLYWKLPTTRRRYLERVYSF
jgi:hypothetical protein